MRLNRVGNAVKLLPHGGLRIEPHETARTQAGEALAIARPGTGTDMGISTSTSIGRPAPQSARLFRQLGQLPMRIDQRLHAATG